jgi:PHP family Zn ribbon phosphoesterase
MNRQEVLQKIFEFLLSNGRKDLVEAYKETSTNREKQKINTARKKWKCCKCGKIIEKGEKYLCVDLSTNTTYQLMRYCLKCSSESTIKSTQSKMKFITEG